ncbi:MAG: hypothetical protein FWB83_07890, partial [Treponema sp.]|nr:hypothetical protein [Treponema sp.]
TLPVFAQESDENEANFSFIMNFTNSGVGMYMPFEGLYIFEFNFELIKFGIEHNASGFGVELSPFKFFNWSGENIDPDYDNIISYSETYFSFLNITAYWNVVNFFRLNSNFFLAPYVTVNYLFMDGNNFYLDRYILGAGLQSGIRGGTDVKYNIFSVETGFRFIENNAKFYVGLKFDVIMLLLNSWGLF